METLVIMVSIGVVILNVVAVYTMAKNHKSQQDYYAAWRKERKEYHSRERAAINAAYTQLYADIEAKLLQTGVQLSHARQHPDIANVVKHPERMN